MPLPANPRFRVAARARPTFAIATAVALCAALLLAIASTATAGSYLIPVSADTWLDEDGPDLVHGAAALLRSESAVGNRKMPLLWFDVGPVGGEAVMSATLFLWVDQKDPQSRPVSVYRVARTWKENSATWATLGDSVDSTVTWATFIPAVSKEWVSCDVTDLVRALQAGVSNHGVALLGEGNPSRYDSRETATPTQAPYLLVQTQPALGFLDLAITKSADPTNVAEGDSVLYSVTITNLGLSAASGVSVFDPVPVGLSWLGNGQTKGSYDSKTGEWSIGGLGPGGSAQLNVLTSVDTGSAGETITNWAWYPDVWGQDGNAANDADSASVTIDFQNGADVGVAIASSDSTPNPGQSVTITVDLDNDGPEVATAIKTAVTIPAGLTEGLTFATVGTWDSGTDVWTVPSLGVGGNGSLIIQASVDLGTDGDTLVVAANVASLDQIDPVPGNNADSTSMIVQSADLAVAVAAADPNPAEGDSVRFTIVLGNSGPTDATGVLVQDSLPTGLTYAGHTASVGSYDDGSGQWTLGDVTARTVDTLSVTTTVDGGTAGGTLSYSALVAASDQPDPDTSNDADSALVTVQSADLAITKTVDDPSPDEGDTVRFTLTLDNTGPNDAAGITVSDVLPAGLTWVGDAPSQGTYDQGTGDWAVGAVAAGSTAVLDLDATIDAGTAGTTIANVSTITASSPPDPVAANDTSGVSVTVRSADLRVTKTASDPIPNEGDSIIYTVAVYNDGPDDATGVSVLDLLPAGVTYSGAGLSQGTYNDSTGVWDVGNVDSAGVATMALVADVDPGTGGSTIVNTASMNGSSPIDPNATNDSQSFPIVVQSADLSLTKTVNNPTPSIGATITYSVDLANAGPDSATSVEVTDALPAGLTFQGTAASHGSYNPGTDVWSVGTVAAADTASLSIFATVNAGTMGQTIWNHAAVTGVDQADPVPGNEADSVSITVGFAVPLDSADLVVDVTADDPTPGEGDTVHYTVTLTNAGPDPAGGVVLSDALPAGVTYVSDTPSRGVYSSATSLWTIGAVAVLEIVTMDLEVTVDAGTAGQLITNTASVSASSVPDPNASNSSNSAVVTVRNADLSLTQAVDDPKPNEGDTVTFTVTLANDGPDGTASVDVTDLLPGGLTFASAIPSSGSYVDSTGLWSVGAMAAGDTVTLALSADVDAGTGGSTLVNSAAVTASAEADSLASNNTAAVPVTVRLADLALAMSVDDPAPDEGDPVTFSLSLTNAGPDSATAVTVTDLLPAGLTYQSDVPSQGSYASGTGDWTVGTVAPGVPASLDVTATVDVGTNGTSIWNVGAITASAVADSVPANDVDSVRVDIPLITGIQVSMSQNPATVRPGQGPIGFATIALANSDPIAHSLSSLTLDNVTVGPGTPGELDAEFGTMTLYRDDGDFTFEPGQDTPLKQASVSTGTVNFGGLGQALPAGAALTLHVGGSVTLAARDGDALDLEIGTPAHVTFTANPTFLNTFPVTAAGGHTVDGSVVAQFVVNPVTDRNVTAGGPPVLVLDAVLPANGYAADTLQELRLRNLGTALAATDYDLTVWTDGGDGAFDGGSGDDTLIGSPTGLGANWTTTGLSTAMPPGGLRVFAVAQTDPTAIPDRTIRLVLPGTGNGIVTAGSNDGPLNGATTFSGTVTIVPPPTPIEVLVQAQDVGPLEPGDEDVAVFSFRLKNTGTRDETLDSATFVNRTTGGAGATQADLDADWAPLTFRRAGTADLGGLARPVGGSFSAGAVTFGALDETIAAGDSARFVVTGSASLVARDGDLLDLRIDAPGDLAFGRTVSLTGTFPLDPAGTFPVDGLTSAQVDVASVSPTLLTGEQRRLSLDAVIPPNGYEADTLIRLDVQNLGTAQSGTDIARVEAWVDDGDDLFSATSDTLLGELTFTGTRWERTGLSVALPTPGGRRIFVTTDTAELATAGNTVQLAIPGPPDPGLGVTSNNDGPVDAAVASSQQTISTVDRVSLTPHSVSSGTTAPGDADRVLLHLTAENSYTVDKTLTALTLTNASTGPGSPAELDAELEQLTFWVDDGNGVFDGAPVDSAIASAFFDTGTALFTGLDCLVPAGGTCELWLTGDVSPTAAADGDVLGGYVESQAHVSFADPTSLAAGFPLDSGARWTVDGLIAAQVLAFDAPGFTLGPSEGPVPAMDFALPGNGYQADQLQELTVVNLGTATDADLPDVRLWRDGGDGSFDAGATDDLDLGAMAFVAGQWILPALTEALPAGSTRFFVSVIASAAPTDSATVQLAIPVDGVEVASGNDGPLDVAVANANTGLLSTAILLASLEITPAASTVDSTVTVSMRVRNLDGVAQIDSIGPSVLSPSGLGTLSLLTGPLPAEMSLPPTQEGTFTWTYQATSSGPVQLSGSANGVEAGTGTPRQTLDVTSNVHQIFVQAQDLDVFAVESMPFSISRGQQNVVPLSITFTNPSGVGGSDIELLGFRVLLENETGGTIIPSDLLSRVVVNEGAVVYLDKSSLETTPVEMDLTLAQPVLIESSGSSSSATLAIALDISDSTSVPNFRLKINDAGSFDARDATSGGPVNIALVDPTVFPISSGLARIVAEATQLDVAAAAAPDFAVGQGQDDVAALQLDLFNPDPSGLAADVRITAFDVQLVDDVGTVIPDPESWIDRVVVDGVAQNHLDRSLTAQDDTTLTLSLATLVSVPVETTVPLTVKVDVADTSSLGTFRLQLADSAAFDARDANTGAPLPVIYAVQPLSGPQLTVEAPADSAVASSVPTLPEAVAVGSPGVAALQVLLSHPGPAETGPIRCDSLTFTCRDGAGSGLVPATYLTAVRAAVGPTEVGLVTSLPGSGSQMTVPITAASIAPFEQVTYDVSVDVAITAPATLFSLTVAADGIHVVDANLGAPAAVRPATGVSFPLTSGFTQLRTPARNLVVGFEDLMPAVLAADGETVTVARITLRNPADATAGDILVDRFEIGAAAADSTQIPLGGRVASIQAWTGESLWASSGTVGPSDGSALLVAPEALVVAPGETVDVRFEATLPSVETAGGFRLGCQSSEIGVVQPGSPLLSVAVLPEDGQSFPLWTQPGNFTGVTLEDSYSNYPNPFAAGREDTQLAFYLKEAGQVSLKVYTLRGEPVRTLLGSAPRAAGLHRDASWDGRNGRGNVVVNGVYLAEIEVAFENGTSERLVRKIAVVR